MRRAWDGFLLAAVLSFLMALPASSAYAQAPPTDRPLTLDECIGTALGTHPKIKAAEQSALVGKYSTDEAISSFWPQVTFDATRDYIHSGRQSRIGGISATTKASYISNNITFNTTWTLFDFGRTYFTVKSLAETEESLLKDLNTTQQSVAYDVMSAYFGLLKSQSLVKVSEETLAANESHLKQAQAFFDVGVKPKFDVTQAMVQVYSAKVSLITAQDAVKSARATLNTKLGYDPTAPTMVQERPDLEEVKKTLQDYYQEALKNRPEVQSFEAKVASNEMSVKSAFANYLPTVSFSADQNWYKEDHTAALANEDLQLSVSVPIFDGFNTQAKVNSARATLLSTKYSLDDQKRTVLLDVSTAFLSVEDARARIESLESSVKAAKENLEIAQGRYEAGVGPLIDVTDAQVSLTKAETDKTQAIYDYHTAYTSLLKSVGQGVK
jgi:outer membrane protein